MADHIPELRLLAANAACLGHDDSLPNFLNWHKVGSLAEFSCFRTLFVCVFHGHEYCATEFQADFRASVRCIGSGRYGSTAANVTLVPWMRARLNRRMIAWLKPTGNRRPSGDHSRLHLRLRRDCFLEFPRLSGRLPLARVDGIFRQRSRIEAGRAVPSPCSSRGELQGRRSVLNQLNGGGYRGLPGGRPCGR
jgi:hypothetical protein